MRRERRIAPFPHRALRESPAFSIRFVVGRMQRSVDEGLTELGFSWAQFAILLVACETIGLSHSALAERTCLNRNTVSQTLADLEEEALIEQRPVLDRRQRHVYPTNAARMWLPRAVEAVEQAQRTALLPLDPRERARLAALLEKAIPPNRGIFGF